MAGGNDSDTSSEKQVMESSKRCDENESRGNWTNSIDFFLSCVGYAVGLGNIWRFPYICFTSGGGAFLIPYLIALAVCGLPLFFLEVAIGQFSGSGGILVWNISPILRGVGFGMVMVPTIYCTIYNVVMAYILFYLAMSFTKLLPWETCLNPWNTAACLQRGYDLLGSHNMSGESNQSQLVDAMMDNITADAGTANISGVVTRSSSATEEFFYNFVLEISEGLHDLGGFHWKLLLAYCIGCFIVLVCLSKGVKSTGKVVYFTVTFPYLILLILLVRGVTLPGALNGIKFYLCPKWEALLEFKVWGLAFVQIFYSLGQGWGAVVTMASYNRFHNNMLIECYLVPVVNSATSLLAGFVVFSVLGYMAEVAQVDIKDIVADGPGLAFMAYPEAITHMALSPLWSILFFFMLLTVVLDSQFVGMETVITSFRDILPARYQKRHLLITVIISGLMFVLGLVFTSRGGSYIFILIDWYCVGLPAMCLSIVEALVVGWIYGADRLLDEVTLMVGKPVFGRSVLAVMWKFIVPAILFFILAFTFITHEPVTYLNYDYPRWSIAAAWTLAAMTILLIPMYAVYYLTRVDRKGSLWQRLRRGLQPSKEWGPAVEPYRSDYWHQRLAQGHVAPPEYMEPNEQKMQFLNNKPE
ncbi:PREDICTED: sodium- and chloride-dependent glycine transporter 1-like [Priapulus caudatus]|uniref:Transporter n=1 Tax=Priapulus caudatus TaxID=37621 RepID=A0ABM1EBP6_PRICU|nr:PREDICTED: sodium- and chloride-dependent glycine transporter 1-like [Priapulus caudatus]XP_014669617.1 PREDICTED: sodium- and chloride-dependent glycine transporter 1-like [Priapulus caudatus]XP_014669619.1 PREDICTED: sodium- and chloride-dependent glycine transporter 1-like [Priapulus caudatus]